MLHAPNQFRIRTHSLLGSDDSIGNNGAFLIDSCIPNRKLFVIISDQDGWEHVSVSISNSKNCPIWNEMVHVKNIFWDEEDCVIQYHPPKSKYINNHPGVLHMWRPLNFNIQLPPKEMI